MSTSKKSKILSKWCILPFRGPPRSKRRIWLRKLLPLRTSPREKSWATVATAYQEGKLSFSSLFIFLPHVTSFIIQLPNYTAILYPVIQMLSNPPPQCITVNHIRVLEAILVFTVKYDSHNNFHVFGWVDLDYDLKERHFLFVFFAYLQTIMGKKWSHIKIWINIYVKQ